MDARRRLGRVLLGREVAVAFAGLAALYLLRVVRFQPVQVPAYLLIVAYDLVEVALPPLTPYHPVGFPLFLYLLAVVAAAASRRLRAGDRAPGWRRPAGGVALVVGCLSLGFGALVGGPLVASADNPTPLAITGAAGLLLVVAGWALLGRPRPSMLGGERAEGDG